MYKRSYGYSQLSIGTSDLNQLRRLKELGVIDSMSGYIHRLILQDIQQMKKNGMLQKRNSVEDKEIQINTAYALKTGLEKIEKNLEKVKNENYDLYLFLLAQREAELYRKLGYTAICDPNDEDIVFYWEK